MSGKHFLSVINARQIIAGCLLLFLLMSLQRAYSQVRISGIVLGSDAKPLPSAYVKLSGEESVQVSDTNGKFSTQLPKGSVSIEISFLGYKKYLQSVLLKNDTLIYFRMSLDENVLQEVEIESQRTSHADQFEETRMSTVNIGADDINSIPALGGEADVIKVIQLLPGVSKGVEGSTDLFVRGGAADQNLVLLDGAPAYNTAHLFGFLSVFNPDVLQDVEYTSGAFPASVGGRLSSILSVNSKSAIAEKTKVQGNIGLLASRLMVQQPLAKNKLSVWVAGRRTYVDQVVKAVGETLPYHFYDINAKVSYKPSASDFVEFTYYAGSDILTYARQRRDTTRRRVSSDFIIRNDAQTLLWKKRLAPDHYATLNLYRTKFYYTIDNIFGSNRLMAHSEIEDYGGKWILQVDSLHHLRWSGGIESVYHQVSPSVISTSGNIAELLESTRAAPRTSLESSAFIQSEGTIAERWLWTAGLRYSSAYVDNKFYSNPEPRLALRYGISESLALKGSYSRMVQYMHRVSSSAIAFPTDIWYPVTRNVQPQISDQVNLSLQKKFSKHNLFATLEGYYKSMNHLVGYREGTNLFFNNDFEAQLIQGRGISYGLEMLVKKESGKLTGWISYTLSKSTRQFDEINNGDRFNARYDRRHNGSLVVNYNLTKRISASAVFEYISGSWFTPIIGQYAVPSPTQAGIELVPVFAKVNSVKLANTHRLDMSVKYRSKPDRKFQSEWFVGVYNVYNRAMPYGIIIEQNVDGSYKYSQPGLFGMLPFFGYGFKF